MIRRALERLGGHDTMQRIETFSIKQATRRAGLAEFVYGHVKDLLLDGRFGPSESIPVDNLASELDVSRQPVMDALKRLSMEGLVVILPQIGCQVRQYQPGEVSDFFRLFAEGEALIAELLAERADRSDVALLSAISSQIGELRGTKAPAEEISRHYRHLNRKLHFEMRRAAQSVPVAEVVESLGDRSDFFIAASGKPLFADRLKAAHAEHETIIAAIRARKPERARDAMREHILNFGKRIRE
jgi:DNA-binding GntR family transcriptional regulator